MAVHIKVRLIRLAFGLEQVGWLLRKRRRNHMRAGLDGNSDVQAEIYRVMIFAAAGRLDGKQSDACCHPAGIPPVSFP